VKGRNEPTAIGGIAWVVQRLLRVPFEDVMDAAWKNSVDLFGLDEEALLAEPPKPEAEEVKEACS
jgi:TatD DNase family protein